jgi:ABC-type multidrug transport system fused ATPase/permease subunit
VATEVVRNVREVRSFGTESRELARFEREAAATSAAARSLGDAAARLESLNRAAIYATILTGEWC